MNESAIILNGKTVCKVSDLKRRYNKYIQNPNIVILEECLKKDLDSKYIYWINKYSPIEDEELSNPNLYIFINKNGNTLHSIYNECKDINYISIKNASREILELFLKNNKCYNEQYYKEAKQKFNEY